MSEKAHILDVPGLAQVTPIYSRPDSNDFRGWEQPPKPQGIS